MVELITDDDTQTAPNLSNIERLRLQLVACLAQLSAEELAFALTEGQQRAAISHALA
jgi:hypothetical protein